MPLTKIGVVYDALTLEVRRIIVPEDDAQFVHHKAGLGEAMTFMPVIGVDPIERANLERAREAVASATGSH